MSCRGYNGSFTTSWKESTELLFNVLLPDDCTQSDDPGHTSLRSELNKPYHTDNTFEPITPEEVETTIKSLKKQKAPGPDGIKSEILHNICQQISPFAAELMSECLRQGKFPNIWKQSEIIILHKGEDKDPLLPKSYRPISMLNVLGKVFEKIMCHRLQRHRQQIGMHPHQYGFRTGRSTVDAIDRAIRLLESARGKYVVGIFVDISGAFDNLWWPALFARLRELECPEELYNTFKDYCQDRFAKIECQGNITMKKLSKGCPQGSVCGPIFWDVGMEPGLSRLEESNDLLGLVAFADDLLLVFEADSRRELESRTNKTLEKLSNWCAEVKLKLAPTKTTYLLLKGKLQRNPTLKINGQSIRRSRTVRYLGIDLDEKLTFMPHIERVSAKANRLMNRFISLGMTKFRLPPRAIKLYHEAILVSIVGYGAGIWGHRLKNTKPAAKLRSLQRGILLRLTGAYRTTATDALTTVLGVVPLDLLIRQRGATFWVKKGVQARAEFILDTRVETTRDVKNAILVMWQTRWEGSNTGRRTYDIFQNVQERLELRHIQPSPGLIHYLTGHGPYMAYLKEKGIADSNVCECGEIGTPEHVVWECTNTAQLREPLQKLLQGRQIGNIIRDPYSWMLLDEASNRVSLKAKEVFINNRHGQRH